MPSGRCSLPALLRSAGAAIIWNRVRETASSDDLTALQCERLRHQVGYVHNRVPFHRAPLDLAGVRPEQIRSLDDVRRLRFAKKRDLRDH